MVIKKTDDRIANPGNAIESPSIELSSSVQSQISANLSGLATTVIWVGSWHEVNIDQSTGMVIGGGAIITLGNINRIDATRVHVLGGVYYANLGAEGGTYVLEKLAEQWQVIGMTGPQWMS